MESSTERPGAVGAEQLDALDTADNEIVRQRVEKLRRLRGEEGYDPYVVEKWERREPSQVAQCRDHEAYALGFCRRQQRVPEVIEP